MGQSHRTGDQIREQSQLRMRSEEPLVVRVERRVQQFFDARDVNLGVLNKGMIAVNRDRNGRKEE